MAETVVVEAALSAMFQAVFERIASSGVVSYFMGRSLNDESLQKLKMLLLSANAVLVDAEEKQVTNPAVKEWLDELNDAVHDADDLFDEIANEELCKVQAESQTGASQVWSSITAAINSFDEGIRFKLEENVAKLEIIIQQMGVLRLKEFAGGVPLRSPQITTSCQELCGVFGRDKDKEAIFELWKSDDSSNNEICVVPIVGMGGIGKTTLAQFIYNDENVNKNFKLKAWVFVSVNFDNFKILKTILEEVTGKPSDFQNLNSLQTEIRKILADEKFVLILDDVWNENYNEWVAFLKVFKCGAKEVKIIVTTRSERVASIVCTVPTHHCLKELEDDKCWDLFVQHAFVNGNSCADLEVIGKQIVKKCRGLPLAVKTVGGSLHSNQNPTHWNKILTNHIWDLPEAKTNIHPSLRLSYYYLPSHLKRCFSYCSIFPKDYEFKKEKLILLWMAEGLLQLPKEPRSMEFEEIGEEYFNDLVSRSFFQRSNKFESHFLMHHLINDLAKSISGKFSFRLEHNDESIEITKKTRHLLYYRAHFDDFKKFEIPCGAEGLRTFLAEKWLSSTWDECNNIGKMWDEFLRKFKCLRVLSLSGKGIKEFPDSVDKLKHLRYLDIHDTEIKHLPDSLCSLYNLQTLILPCNVSNLPTNMGKLINLRHLEIFGNDLKEMPPQMGRLKNLRKLSVFVVGKHSGSCIRELGKLRHLSGKLSILNLENVYCIKDAREVMLKDKQDLYELELKWKGGQNTTELEKEIYVLEQLCPHPNLKSLTLQNYESTRFPNWLGDSSFLNLVSLKLIGCFSLPCLGQLTALKKLEIVNFKGVCVGQEFYGNGSSKPFRSLEHLSFEDMLEWEEWVISEGEVFSCLQELRIRHCPKLSRGLPNHLPSLIKLEIEDCNQLVASLPEAPILHEVNCHGKIQLASGCCYPSLERLNIWDGCDSSWSFPLDFFPSLKCLEVLASENLESLSASEGSDLSLSLTYFLISDCPNFVSFPSRGLCAQKMTEMKVSSCKKLKSLPEGMHALLPSLVTLVLSDCPELESFPEGGLPSNLERLTINYCDKLISCHMEWELQGLHSLKEFRIQSNCEEVESFPEEAVMPSNLTTFWISSFPKLKSLNGKGFQNLTSLVYLKLVLCPALESFPEGGFPSNLETLDIEYCEKLISCRMEWGLQGLHSLRHVYIKSKCEEVDSFPEEALLPPTLTDFTISDFPNLTSLNGKGFQQLTSLQCLVIRSCLRLKCLPEEGLPTSLSELKIMLCPSLIKWCETKRGKTWLKIARIPYVRLNVNQA